MVDIFLKFIAQVKAETEESVSNCRYFLEIMNADSDGTIEVISRFRSQGITDLKEVNISR